MLDMRDVKLEVITDGDTNHTSIGVRATHVPTGKSTECGEFISQHRNKEKAVMLLAKEIEETPRE